MTIYFWSDLTSPDIARLDAARTIALLPVSATEQHGPHLPLGTDAMINAAICKEAYGQIAEDVAVVELPAQEVGDSLEHTGYPGTLSLPAETLIAAWTEIGRCVARTGLKKIVIFNSHGGQPQLVDITAQRLRAEAGMLAVRANSFAWPLPKGLFDPAEEAFGFHAGAIETSLMLAIAPELVRQDALQDFQQLGRELAQRNTALGPEGPLAGFAWQSQDLHPAGASGDATAATPEKGTALLAHMGGQLAAILRETADFPLDRLA